LGGKSDPESDSGNRIPPSVLEMILPTGRPNHNIKF